MQEEVKETPKRGRGRPKKNTEAIVQEEKTVKEENVAQPKRGRGRPRKNPEVTVQKEESKVVLPGFEDEKDDMVLPGFGEQETIMPVLKKKKQ